MAHPIVHVELSTANPEADGEFYHALFGWEVRHHPNMGNYVTFHTDDWMSRGMNPISNGHPPGATIVYVGTDDVHATINKAESLGAKVLATPFEVQGIGWMATFQDGSGNVVSLLQAPDNGAAEGAETATA